LLTIRKCTKKLLEAQSHQLWYGIDSVAIDIAPWSTIKGKTSTPSESYPHSAPCHILLPSPTATLLMVFSNFCLKNFLFSLNEVDWAVSEYWEGS
jgi:hypothetical protein